MIAPNRRSLLSDALTPPAGMHFDSGIVTTYSLDPVMLLSVPLHLAWHGLGGDRRRLEDPVLLVDALQRIADRLTIFSQRGRLLQTETGHQLAGLLDSMIFEAEAPHGGAFHPKFWLLRFLADADDPPLLRLLIPTRNLTADSSWDLCLHLEGRPESPRIDTNVPLADFLTALPKCSRRKLTARRRADLKTLGTELPHCNWNLPEDFTSIRFHVLGLGPKPTSWFPDHSDELGVISPFVRGKALKGLCQGASRPLFLLSRPEEMDKLTSGLEDFEHLETLDPQAEDDGDAAAGSRLRGLHAKAYVFKRGWDTHLILGSANATDAALVAGSNVEILAELIGRCSRVGRPETWLSNDAGLGEMLLPYAPQSSNGLQAPDAEALRLEDMRNELTALDMELLCEREQDDAWSLMLHPRSAFELGDVLLDARPLTVDTKRAARIPVLDPARPVKLGVFTAAEITSLMAFRLRLGKEESFFALNLPLSGGPEDRDVAILGLILRNKAAFVRYLLLLLADENQFPAFPMGQQTAGGEETAGWRNDDNTEDVPLFELLARAWAREPERLNAVAKLVQHFRDAADKGREQVLPPEFLEIWQTFETAMNKEAGHDGTD